MYRIYIPSILCSIKPPQQLLLSTQQIFWTCQALILKHSVSTHFKSHHRRIKCSAICYMFYFQVSFQQSTGTALFYRLPIKKAPTAWFLNDYIYLLLSINRLKWPSNNAMTQACTYRSMQDVFIVSSFSYRISVACASWTRS